MQAGDSPKDRHVGTPPLCIRRVRVFENGASDRAREQCPAHAKGPRLQAELEHRASGERVRLVPAVSVTVVLPARWAALV